MPLPAHLAQKLAQRGIIKRNFNKYFDLKKYFLC